MKNTSKKIIGGTIVGLAMFTQTFAMTETTAMKDKMMATDTKMMMKDGAMMNDSMSDTDKMMKMKMMMEITKTSSRSEVAKLQQHLIDEGFLKVRAGTKLGYYGALTKAAYAKYSAKMKIYGDSMMMKDEKMMMKDGASKTMMKDGAMTDTMMKK